MDYGVTTVNGQKITLTSEAKVSNQSQTDTQNYHVVRMGETYWRAWEAEGFLPDGRKVRVYWYFGQIKGAEVAGKSEEWDWSQAEDYEFL